MKPYSKGDGAQWFRTHRLSRATFISILSRSPYINTTSDWLLGATAVAAGFLLSHLTELSSHIYPEAIRLSLYAVAFGAACGLLQKAFSYLVTTQLEIEQELTRNITDLINTEKDSITPDDIKELASNLISEIREPVPSFLQKLLDSSVQKGEQDPLFGFKRAYGHLFIQFILCLGQLLILVIALLLIAFGFH